MSENKQESGNQPEELTFRDELKIYIQAGYPILYLVTPEEVRAIELIAELLTSDELSQRKPYVWSISRGLCDMNYKTIDRKTGDPTKIIPYLIDFQEPGVFILEDFHSVIDEKSQTSPIIKRQLRDVVTPFKASRKTIVILSPVLKIPPELEKDITVLDLEPPTEEELLATLEETIEQVKDKPQVEINLDGNARETIVKALSGLTQTEAENALAKVIVSNSRLDPEDIPLLLAEKEQIIRKSGMLEFYSSPEQFGSVGGLDQLKEWLRQRGRGFSEEAKLFGLPSPKGLMLVGVPGCGKSLTAKAVASEWKMPLLKFDLGKVFGGLVGQSEENMRRAIKMAEAVAPCVLWIDEIEKGLSGSRGGQGDGGTAQRVFGTMLTWMEENTKPVFTIATANDIEGLPPELLRKGRFDEIFFIDLPNPNERGIILAIHLGRRQRDYKDFDLSRHVQTTEGFSGAELEQVIISALYEAFGEGEDMVLEDRHLEQVITDFVPLSQSMGRKIAKLRAEAKEKWRNASGEPDKTDTDETEVSMPEPPPVPKKQKRIFDL